MPVLRPFLGFLQVVQRPVKTIKSAYDGVAKQVKKTLSNQFLRHNWIRGSQAADSLRGLQGAARRAGILTLQWLHPIVIPIQGTKHKLTAEIGFLAKNPDRPGFSNERSRLFDNEILLYENRLDV
jgi:hypothetical protein